MRKPSDHDEPTLPFPTSPVSNMEWLPLPISAKQRLVAKLIREETETREATRRRRARSSCAPPPRPRPPSW
jgi:hypothetical protein